MEGGDLEVCVQPSTGILLLAIKKGGYKSIPKEQLLCVFCDLVEDEFYFVFLCCLYNDLRSVFI